MKIIVGLGNPEEKYFRNRHNVGFMYIDYLHKTIGPLHQKFIFEKKTESLVHKVRTAQEEILLVKPQTFMNDSGRSIQKVLSYYNQQISDVVVAHDDLDIELGKYKIQSKKGPKIHNGISSVEKCLGTDNFIRVRIGIENRNEEKKIPGKTYVLQNFTLEEMKQILHVFKKIELLNI